MMDIRKAENALRKLAEQRGLSVAEVRREIQASINEGLNSSDPLAMAYWAIIPKTGEIPTPEEVILYIAQLVEGEL